MVSTPREFIDRLCAGIVVHGFDNDEGVERAIEPLKDGMVSMLQMRDDTIRKECTPRPIDEVVAPDENIGSCNG